MTQTLEIRQTRKYVGSYQHMDQWSFVGTYEVLAKASTEPDDEDPCEGYSTTYLLAVKAEEATSEEEIKQALRDSFTNWGCSHEWDCCGCWSVACTKAEHLAGDRWEVITASSRNY